MKNYTALGNYAVLCGSRIIAISVLGKDTYEALILQGIPRDETCAKIIDECPDFATANNMSNDRVIGIFCKMSKEREKEMIQDIKQLI